MFTFTFTLLPDLTMINTVESYKKQELLTLRKHLGSPTVFCAVVVVLFLSAMCFVLNATCISDLWTVHT